MTDAISRVREQIALRDAAFAAIETTKSLDYSDENLRELLNALIDAAPEMLRAVEENEESTKWLAERDEVLLQLSAALEREAKYQAELHDTQSDADKLRAKNARLKDQVSRLRASIGKLVSEVDFVTSGGDDERDRCLECGLAGIGMLRDARTESIALLKETE